MKHLLTLFLLTIWVVGCTQRECDYNPITGLVHYKSVSFATDASADIIRIKTPSGVQIEIVRIKQDSDSIKLVVPPYGAIETMK